jgi:hypothetical protein
MPGWQELFQTLLGAVRGVIGWTKRHRREESLIALAALLFWIGSSLSGGMPPELKKWLETWAGLWIAQAVCYLGGSVFLAYGGYRIWRLVSPPELPPPKDLPSAIKGPMAFTTRADGPLFRKLGREEELRKLLGWIQDDQVRLVVVWGAAGAGKTSLLRAGLMDILSDTGIGYHYWEAVPSDPGGRMLRAIRESWGNGTRDGRPRQEGQEPSTAAQVCLPESLGDLVNPSADLCPRKHVIVLDQFEQMRGRDPSRCPVLRLLRSIARKAMPPHRVTWIVAFRREFLADWSELMISEQEHGFYPPELPVRPFSQEQAKEVVSRLAVEAGLSVEQKVVDDLVKAATERNDVSPVDIGVGLLILAELHSRQGGQTVTIRDYRFAPTAR